MKKLFLSALLVLSGFISFALCTMYSDNTRACIKYNATTGKVTVELTHNSPPSSPLWWVDCGYANFYASPYTTWLYIKNPSAAGFFGPFEVTGNVAHDPATGKAYTYYDVTIPGFSTQECYEVYAVSNRTWYYSDPTNSWGFVPSSSLDPTVSPYNNWTAPDTKVYEIYSTQIPYTACLCSESDTMPPCNSNFTLDQSTHTRYVYGLTALVNFASIKLHSYNPYSTYIYEWDGVTGTSTLPSLSLGGSLSLTIGSHTVCVTEITSSGDTCKTCLDFCVGEGYTESGRGSGSIMKKTTELNPSLNTADNVEIYPNPSNGISEIKFSLSKKEFVEINVTSISGQKLIELPSQEYNPGTGKIEINTSNLPIGVYQVHIKTGNEHTTKKLSVIK